VGSRTGARQDADPQRLARLRSAPSRHPWRTSVVLTAAIASSLYLIGTLNPPPQPLEPDPQIAAALNLDGQTVRFSYVAVDELGLPAIVAYGELDFTGDACRTEAVFTLDPDIIVNPATVFDDVVDVVELSVRRRDIYQVQVPDPEVLDPAESDLLIGPDGRGAAGSVPSPMLAPTGPIGRDRDSLCERFESLAAVLARPGPALAVDTALVEADTAAGETRQVYRWDRDAVRRRLVWATWRERVAVDDIVDALAPLLDNSRIEVVAGEVHGPIKVALRWTGDGDRQGLLVEQFSFQHR
jgi:hypothetical protein